MLAELREELNAPEPEPDVHMDANLGERETKTAVRTIIDNQNQARQEQHQQTERNKVIGKNNKLWAHFVRISEFMAKCKHCSKTLSSKHSSSNLMRHIIRRHHNLSKNLSYSQHSLISPKKELMQPEDRRQGDPLEKVDFDDVDSIIEKVTDHMDDEVSIDRKTSMYCDCILFEVYIGLATGALLRICGGQLGRHGIPPLWGWSIEYGPFHGASGRFELHGRNNHTTGRKAESGNNILQWNGRIGKS